MQDALDRAKAYIEAGVDGIMIHSKSAEAREVLEFAKRYRSMEGKVPLVAVPTTYNSISFEELTDAGFNIVVYANHLLRSAYPAMMSTARSILENKRSLESESGLEPVSGLLTLIPGNL